ncbi:hypothetical protein V6U89_19390 [Micromonospora sp. CPCC 206171]|uniref:hypothetical protein n=1 Tax=Micromonospora sp. CPCC 206171 TaxID=3122405 RepID=UPI002FF0524D
MPSGTWSVQVTDIARDIWDWVALGGSLLFGAASLFVGTVAVVLASKANQAAVKAAEEAERANEEASRARAAVAAERRRTFELEILRDLLEVLDQERDLVDQIASHPEWIEIRFAGRLGMLPEQDLPLWRRARGVSWRELIDLLGGPDEHDEERVSIAESGSGSYRPARSLINRLREKMTADVLMAIQRRMTAHDR